MTRSPMEQEASFVEIIVATQELGDLMFRAWRRPVADDARATAIAFFDGRTFDTGAKMALLYTLASPQFLHTFSDGSVDFETADRLSLFLWGRTPDVPLLDKAKEGLLSSPETLRAEVDRLLNDRARSQSFFTDFASQWLGLRRLSEKEPNLPNYPALRADFQAEVVLFLEEMVRSNRSIAEMFTASFGIISRELAAIYKADWAQRQGGAFDPGGRFAKVPLPPGERRGLLTLVGVLTTNAIGNREPNPIMRGHWMTKEVFCREPPPAPDNVPPLAESPAAGPIKKRLEDHRQQGACRVCHALMDPLGLGLHNFGSYGQFRTTDSGGFAIDPSGEIDGRAFRDVPQMIDVVAGSSDVKGCFMSHLAAFAVGRVVDGRRWCSTQRALAGAGLKDLLGRLVSSDLFLTHEGK